MGLDDYLSERLSEAKARSLYRSLSCIDGRQGPVVRFADSRERAIFCSNNYLNLAGEQRISDAVIAAVRRFGWGAAASRLISGTMSPHVEVEERFAEFFKKAAALYFSSGWCANQAVLTALPQAGDLVLVDKLDHASIIDGVRGGAATFRTYRRDESDRLERMLADRKYARKFIVTESVFSMDGNIADLAALVAMKKKHAAILIVDEAHSVGCMGPSGAGLAERAGLLEQIDIIISPLGKAFACGGAVVAASRVVIDYLINAARSFIYTTAPSPVAAAAAVAALDIVQKEQWRRDRLQENAEYLRDRLQKMSLDTGGSQTHIIPVILGVTEKAVKIAAALFGRGYYVPAIRPPTVPKGSARLRISVQCGHTREQMDGLCAAIADGLCAG